MLNELKEKIKNKKLILVGEIHGTKEIPELLSKFFSEIAEKEDFNVCFEILDEFQENPEEFFKDSELGDGKNSKEYFNLIKELNEMNKNTFFIAPSKIESQEELERSMAENIKKVLDKKQTFVILGDMHASKNPLNFQGLGLETAGSVLFKEFQSDFFNIRIVPRSGKFFNFGIKEINEDFLDEDFNKNFDYVYILEKVTPCTFVKKGNV